MPNIEKNLTVNYKLVTSETSLNKQNCGSAGSLAMWDQSLLCAHYVHNLVKISHHQHSSLSFTRYKYALHVLQNHTFKLWQINFKENKRQCNPILTFLKLLQENWNVLIFWKYQNILHIFLANLSLSNFFQYFLFTKDVLSLSQTDLTY